MATRETLLEETRVEGRIVRGRPRLIFIPLTGTGRFFRFRGRYPFSFLLHISLDGGHSLQALPLGHWPGYSRGIINASRVSDCTFEGVSRNSKESGGKKGKKGRRKYLVRLVTRQRSKLRVRECVSLSGLESRATILEARYLKPFSPAPPSRGGGERNANMEIYSRHRLLEEFGWRRINKRGTNNFEITLLMTKIRERTTDRSQFFFDLVVESKSLFRKKIINYWMRNKFKL